MDRTVKQTIADLRMLLRDERPCTTADLTDAAVVYLDCDEIKGVFLSDEELSGLGEPFVVDASFVGDAHENLQDWFIRPRFSFRPALREWALDTLSIDSAIG
ncbi:hypothetical protein ACT2FY_39125 [Paraburkholderia fungorum]|uniref:hypothetical protein n=1 Tax=Paraburkholderia fungorum TaxID=134537 RepID=UPI00402B15EC